MASCVQLDFSWELLGPPAAFAPVEDESGERRRGAEPEITPDIFRGVTIPDSGEGIPSGEPEAPSSIPSSSPLPVRPTRDRQSLVESLQQRISQVERSGRRDVGTMPTEASVLERLFPAGGIARGITIEWVAMQSGSSAGYLAWLAACHAMRHDEVQRVIVVVDRRGVFYPPAAMAALGGLAEGLAKRLVVVRPVRDADAVWAMDQALRSSAVCCVWGELPRVDERAARRLQLAAEEGAGLGLWVRPANTLQEPSWAEARWKVTGVPAQQGGRQLSVELVRCRGGRAGATALFEIDETTGQLLERSPVRRPHDATGAVRLAAELAHPTSTRRAGERTSRSA